MSGVKSESTSLVASHKGDHDAIVTCNDDPANESGSTIVQSISGNGFSSVIPRAAALSSHMESLVLKHELQRMLTVLRSAEAKSRYISTGRFTEEFVDDIHPVAQKMEDLHQSLSHDLSESDLSAFVEVVCDAVESGDVSLAVTGKALETLQTLLAYGLIRNGEALMTIATCLVRCKFEVMSDDGSKPLAAVTPSSSASAPIARRVNSSASQCAQVSHDKEEEALYKLMMLISLVTRLLLSQRHAETEQTNVLVAGLLEKCWRAVSKAGTVSTLLHSTVITALSEVIIHVFTPVPPGSRPDRGSVTTARLSLLKGVSSLLGGTSAAGVSSGSSSLHLIRTGLSLLNLSLELCSAEFSETEMSIVRDELCKHFLLAGSNRDVVILADTLRVISNLLPRRENLKVQLEVLLTNVHFRVLRERADSSPEDRELVLESLLACCQESNLVTDLYYNYDCDVLCTNLYESLVAALGQAAMPYDWTSPWDEDAGSAQMKPSPLAPEEYQPANTGIPVANATFNGNSKANGGSRPSLKTHLEASNPKASRIGPVNSSQYSGNGNANLRASTTPLNHLNRLAIESLFAMLDSISKRYRAESTASGTESPGASEYDAKQKLFRQCKQKKIALSKVSASFNADPMGSTWMDVAVTEGQLDDEKSAGSVAKLLYTAPGLDKATVGEYLSKGPSSDYPFHAEVRNQFAALFDFSDFTFAASLRMFLSRFRLPGEAQCIDRLMEAFSGQLYKQQSGKTFFKNSDAVYVLSFSTIMLNTDLHNPTIKKDSRMTLKQFIRNNRGINGGEDIPEEFLSELYEQIKDEQIQVRQEMAEMMTKNEYDSDFRTAWESIVAKSHEVSTPFFSSCNISTPETFFHDRQMFSTLAKWLVHAVPSTFLRSWDDALVVRALNGMKNLARLAALFEVNWVIDEVLVALLPMGRDYISGCVALDYATVNDSGSVVSIVSRTNASTEAGAEDDETTTCESELPIPFGLLSSRDERIHRTEIFGSASHRGILALDCCLVLLQRYTTRVSKIWPNFVECLCGLRDARALPPGLADLDDFADSDGSVLPLSSFAKTSQRRLDQYYRAKLDPDASKQKGWFRSLFKKSSNGKESDSFDEDDYVALDRGELSSYSRALLGLAEASGIEGIIQTCSTHEATAKLAIRAFLGAVGRYPYDDDPVLEQHAVFSLELATRALLLNRRRASDSFVLFLNQLENILSQANESSIPSPFVLERLVVTVLRACIHLYEHQELRPHLRASLHLLTMALPKSFLHQIADRMACGMAIILRTNFQYFETPNEWAFMGDTLDMLAQHDKARVFVFDGIASTVEYTLPPSDTSAQAECLRGPDHGQLPELSIEACTALSRILFRFILGFYKNDYSLNVPAMLCLEKLYRRRVELVLEDEAALRETDDSKSEAIDPSSAAPDKELWQNLAVAIYSCCRSTDPEVSQHGCECFQRVILHTQVSQIPDEKWIAVLYLIVNKQPPMVAFESRMNCFSILGQLLNRVVPTLSNNPDNRDDLFDLVSSLASLAADNMLSRRRGSVSPLFEVTLQTVTYLSNHMRTPEWIGDPEFSSWASEALLSELEKAGAVGGPSIKSQNGVQPADNVAIQSLMCDDSG